VCGSDGGDLVESGQGFDRDWRLQSACLLGWRLGIRGQLKQPLLGFYSFGAAVDVVAAFADETDEGDVKIVGQCDGHAGGGADAGDDGDAGDERFL